MKAGDIEGYLDCQVRIWEALRGLLPEDFIEANLNWTRRPESKDNWVRAIDDASWILLVAEEGDSIAGMAQGRVDWSRLCHLGFLGVDPGHRRREIARSLVHEFIEESRRRGASKISLETSPTLKPAVKLYAEMGFTPEGFLRRHRMGVDMIVYSMFLE